MTLRGPQKILPLRGTGYPKPDRKRPLKSSCEDEVEEEKNPLAVEGPGQIIDVKG